MTTPTGYIVGTTDLSQIFQPLNGGTPGITTGFLVGNTDLNQLFAPLNGVTHGITTGFLVFSGQTGQDLNQIFAPKQYVTVTNQDNLTYTSQIINGNIVYTFNVIEQVSSYTSGSTGWIPGTATISFAGITSSNVILIGGGGAGGNCSNSSSASGGGGGGGGFYSAQLTGITGNYYITVGSGGNKIFNFGPTKYLSGQPTTIGNTSTTLLTAFGGSVGSFPNGGLGGLGGTGGMSQISSFNGGTGGNGSENIGPGTTGSNGFTAQTNYAYILGGGGGGGGYSYNNSQFPPNNNCGSGFGATSNLGGYPGNTASQSDLNYANGVGYGAGGGGSVGIGSNAYFLNGFGSAGAIIIYFPNPAT